MTRGRTNLIACALVAISSLFGCASPNQDRPPLQTVAHVDLQRYLGTWYEIARFPHRFQAGCVESRAVYTLRDDGLIGVHNECRQGSADGPVKSAEGRARVVDRATNAKLEVSFFRPFWGDYWIIDLDPDYHWAVVGHPSRKYLWILCRDKTLGSAALTGITRRLEQQGYDLSALLFAKPR
jgi:apolipoprotein D and lipocalin family protein